MKAKLHYVFSLAIFLITFSTIGQNSSWQKIETPKQIDKLERLNLDKSKVEFYTLDVASFKKETSQTTLK